MPGPTVPEQPSLETLPQTPRLLGVTAFPLAGELDPGVQTLVHALGVVAHPFLLGGAVGRGFLIGEIGEADDDNADEDEEAEAEMATQ